MPFIMTVNLSAADPARVVTDSAGWCCLRAPSSVSTEATASITIYGTGIDTHKEFAFTEIPGAIRTWTKKWNPSRHSGAVQPKILTHIFSRTAKFQGYNTIKLLCRKNVGVHLLFDSHKVLGSPSEVNAEAGSSPIPQLHASSVILAKLGQCYNLQ